jgi:23S rRNA pseudouridine2457 synthase
VSRYIAFYKPYEVLSQFTDAANRKTLKDFISIKDVYAAGRLDYRSEGLLLITDDGALIHRLTDPRFEHTKTYFVQVEGVVKPDKLSVSTSGILLPGFQLRRAEIKIIPQPSLPARSKPVRDYHPTSWLKVVLREGKKHQVRRMTAALGFPTLRLVRVAIGDIPLGDLQPGQWRLLSLKDIKPLLLD